MANGEARPQRYIIKPLATLQSKVVQVRDVPKE